MAGTLYVCWGNVAFYMVCVCVCVSVCVCVCVYVCVCARKMGLFPLRV